MFSLSVAMQLICLKERKQLIMKYLHENIFMKIVSWYIKIKIINLFRVKVSDNKPWER